MPVAEPPGTESRSGDDAGSFASVSAGWRHTCGVKTDGSVVCWGSSADFFGNVVGQTAPPQGSFRSVSAGADHTCGLKTDGSIACWGSNLHHNGNFVGQSTPPDGSFVSVSAEAYYTCALTTDDSIICWGDNDDGEATPPEGTFSSVSTGVIHACGVKEDLSLACWGDDWIGQATPPDGSFTSVSAGYSFTCGVREDGSIDCWGDDRNGEATPPDGSFVSVSAGDSHACGVRADRSIACWGYDGGGRATPPEGSFKLVSAGAAHTCGVKTDGSIACWGRNEDGQATPPTTMPVVETREDDHGDSAGSATPVEIGAVVQGVLEAGDIDYFSFEAEKGKSYQVVATPKSLSGSLEINKYGPDNEWLGIQLATGGLNHPVTSSLHAERSGSHYVKLEGGTGSYTLEIAANTPTSTPTPVPTAKPTSLEEPGPDLTGEQMAAIMLTQDDIDTEFPSLSFEPDLSGLIDNAETAENTFDPDDTESDIAAAGRIIGYAHRFFDRQALLGGSDEGPVGIDIIVHVLKDEESASEFLVMLSTEANRFEDKEVGEGVTLLSVTPVISEVVLGDGLEGYQAEIEFSTLGKSLLRWEVFWRRGTAVLSLGFFGHPGSDPGPALFRLAVKMDQKVGPALAGEITVVPETDRAALVVLYNSTDGPNWWNNENWLSDEPLLEWHGVTTNSEGSVTGLDLSINGLTGSIPPDLGNLTNLRNLSLGGNELGGEIPVSLGNLTNLELLRLDRNQLTGCIPAGLRDVADNDLAKLGLAFCDEASNTQTSGTGTGKYDADGDGLIDVSNLEQLHAIRHDLNGDGIPDRDSGYSEYYNAFPIGATEAVCNDCIGYELTRSLGFNKADSYASGVVNTRWTVGSGWEPVGNSEDAFLAIFDGNGHTLSDLYLFRVANSDLGLFGFVGDTSTIRNIGLLDIDITGLNGVGGLAGSSAGTIRDSYTTGTVSGKGDVGGLIGRSRGSIVDSHSSCRVSGGKEWLDANAGGLVGANRGEISSSYATGSVSGEDNVGGLAGTNIGPSSAIRSSHATGNVSGTDYVGGLTGISHGKIALSYATGIVSGEGESGGLAAINYGTVDDSYATGSVSAYWTAGGLVGENIGIVSGSYATGSASGSGTSLGGEHDGGIGGLVGFNEGTIVSSYARGSVTGVGVTVGGLVAANSGTVIATYSTGKASSSSEHEYVGGLIGSNTGAVMSSFWDAQSSGNETGFGYGELNGAEGKTTSELQSPTGYTGIYSDWGEAGEFWDFGTSSQYPALVIDFDGDGAASWQEFGKQRSRIIPSPTSRQGGTPEPLAASFPASPFQSPRHKGEDDRPQVIVTFSRPVRSFGQNTPSVSVAGAVVSSLHRHHEEGLENAWVFLLDPAGTGDIKFALIAGHSCDAGGICTREGNILEVAPEARTIPGPRSR